MKKRQTLESPELFEIVEEHFEPGVNLSNTALIACQHLLGSQLEIFQRLIKNHGLNPKNCWIIGKNYSSNKLVFKELKKIGCRVDDSSLEFDYQRPFDEWFDEKIDNFINLFIEQNKFDEFDQVIILDDGGRLINRVHNSVIPSEKLAAIEQTSSGYKHLKNVCPNPRFEVIMVARTSAKLIYETPFITKLGIERIVKHIKKRNLFPSKILVMGQGPIGTSLSRRLEQLEVRHESFDIKLNPEGLSHFLESRREDLKNFNVIIGTTGAEVFNEEDLKKMNPSVSLISLSSSDREFPSAFIRCQNNNLGIHADYFFGKQCLVNSGFPITFYGNYHELSPKLIEITCSMLYAAVLLSASKNSIRDMEYLGSKLSDKFVMRLDTKDYEYNF